MRIMVEASAKLTAEEEAKALQNAETAEAQGEAEGTKKKKKKNKKKKTNAGEDDLGIEAPEEKKQEKQELKE